MCAENIERLRASFTVPPPSFTLIPTTTTGSAEEINYSQGGRVGLQARVHTSSMGNYLGERRGGMRLEEGKWWKQVAPFRSSLKFLIPQGDTSPSSPITPPIHFSILLSDRLFRSALASLLLARCQTAPSEKTIRRGGKKTILCIYEYLH